jgi:hypothetical protein
MTNFSPKQNFITLHPAAALELQTNREAAWLKIALSYAVAEMAHRGASQGKMEGARDLIETLQNLWDKGEEIPRLPVQRLESYDKTPEEILKAQKAAMTESPKK